MVFGMTARKTKTLKREKREIESREARENTKKDDYCLHMARLGLLPCSLALDTREERVADREMK